VEDQPFKGVVILLSIGPAVLRRRRVFFQPLTDLLSGGGLVHVGVVTAKHKNLQIRGLPQTGNLVTTTAGSCILAVIAGGRCSLTKGTAIKAEICGRSRRRAVDSCALARDQVDMQSLDGPERPSWRLPVQITQRQTAAQLGRDERKDACGVVIFN